MKANVVMEMTHVKFSERIRINNANKLKFGYALILFYRITDLRIIIFNISIKALDCDYAIYYVKLNSKFYVFLLKTY